MIMSSSSGARTDYRILGLLDCDEAIVDRVNLGFKHSANPGPHERTLSINKVRLGSTRSPIGHPISGKP